MIFCRFLMAGVRRVFDSQYVITHLSCCCVGRHTEVTASFIVVEYM